MNNTIKPDQLRQVIKSQLSTNTGKDTGLGAYMEKVGKLKTNSTQTFRAINNAVKLLNGYLQPLGLEVVFKKVEK